MSTLIWPAQGTTLAVDESGTNANGTFTLWNNITSVTGLGGGEVGKRDTTVLTSTVKTSAPTIPDPQQVSVEFPFDPTDSVHKFIRNLKDSPLAFCNFKATLNAPSNTNSGNNATVVFSAWVQTFEGYDAEDVDSNLTTSVTLQQTGAPTWNSAT